MTKKEHLNIDKRIIQKIMIMVFSGIALEVCFGILSIVVITTNLSTTPAGTLEVLYISAVLELLSLGLVLIVFNNIRSKEIDNLLWIKKIVNKTNNINKGYMFQIPQLLNNNDVKDTKYKFLSRINIA
jgi:hypothetical protein